MFREAQLAAIEPAEPTEDDRQAGLLPPRLDATILLFIINDLSETNGYLGSLASLQPLRIMRSNGNAGGHAH